MRSFRFPMVALLAACAGAPAASAQVPNSDIWLADIAHGQDGMHLVNPVNVTNRPGYDNQPAFLPGGQAWGVTDVPSSAQALLFTSADPAGSTDIYRWDSTSRSITRVTNTSESEYSPTPFGSDGHGGATGFYCVRVEADSTQRLWRFDLDGSHPQVFMAEVDSVGYFAWIDDGHIAAFVLGNEKKKEPHTLRVIDVATQRETIVARGIGRSITRIPDSSDICFTVEDGDDTFRFMRLDHGRTTGASLIDATGAGQDAAWMTDGTMLMSAGTTVYLSSPPAGGSGARGAWRPIADFAAQGMSAVTRLVVSPDQRTLAFVATTAAP